MIRAGTGQCLTVMVTSIKEGRAYDAACVLDVGDHPYITKRSYLLYRMADAQLADHISKMVELSYYEVNEDMGAEVFERIARGLFDSEEVKMRVIRYANSVGI